MSRSVKEAPFGRKGRQNAFPPKARPNDGLSGGKAFCLPTRPKGALLALASLLAATLAFATHATTEPPPIEHWQMGTDTVFLLEDHRTPLVHVRLEFPVGNWSAWARDNHAADAFSIQAYDPERRLLARADRLGVELDVGMGSVSAWLQATCLAEDTAALLTLLRDLLANRDFDTSELGRWHQQRDLAWDANRKDPQFTLTQAGARLLLAEDDPRRRPWEEPARGTTNEARLLAARDAVVRVPGRVVAVSGSVSRAELEPLLDGILPSPQPLPGETLTATARERHETLLPLRPLAARPDETTVTLPRLTQVYLALVRDAPPRHHPDFPAFQIASHVLTGHFYSRMYVALRHDAGETYTVSAPNYGTIHRPLVHTIRTFTHTANAGRTERIFRDTLATFHAEGITEEERSDAVGNLTGRRLFQRQTPRQVLAEHLTERRLAFPQGLFEDLPVRAAALSLNDINAFIKRFYDPAQFRLVRVEAED